MAKSTSRTNETEDFQLPLMNVFRTAAKEHDQKLADQGPTNEDRQVTQRQIERREGVSIERLQAYLLTDLANLMGTIHLEAASDLDDYPAVRRSVLNYGVLDVTRLSGDQGKDKSLEARFRQALLDHEPRLIPSTVVVKLRDVEKTAYHSVSFAVEAVMAARPVDVPLEFTAEIDVGAGKVQVAKVAVNE